MRTRTLLAVAALSAAGLATSLAQSNVYSVNIVGYVNQAYPGGDASLAKQFSLAVNPLKTANNTISEVIPNPSSTDFVIVHTWNPVSQTFNPANNWNPFVGAWGVPGQVLDQGTGFFIQKAAGTPWTNTYVGEVVTSKTITLLPGLNLVGSSFPKQGTIDPELQLVPGTAPADFHVVTLYTDGVGYQPSVNYNPFVGWPGGTAPTLKVAQGMWFLNGNTAKPWVQNFTVQ